MKWARIENDLVVETTEINPEGRFHASLIWVQCPVEVEQRWAYVDGNFSAPAE